MLKGRENHKAIKPINDPPIDPFVYSKRKSFEVLGTGGSNVPRVVADFSSRRINNQTDLNDIGYFYNAETDKWNMSDLAADVLYLGSEEIPFEIPNRLKAVYDFDF